MKKNLLYGLALFAASLLGSGQAKAQMLYEVAPMSEDAKTMTGQISDMMLTDPDGANKIFTKLMRKIRSNKEDLVAVGKFFLEKNVYPCAKQCAQQVYELAPEYIPGLMFNGEVCMVRKDYGNAGVKFDEVLRVDSTYVPAIKEKARVYKYINPYEAIDALQRITQLEPDNYGAYKELGDIAYNESNYKDAVASYDKYYELVPKTKEELEGRACEYYVLSLFSMQKGVKAKKVANEALGFFPDSKTLKAIRFFCDVDDYDLDAAAKDIAYITEKEYADTLYTYLDYYYAATLADYQSNLPQAIDYYKQALAVDASKVAGYKQLTDLMRRNKQAVEAIPYYKKMIELKGDKADLTDEFGLAQLYLAASQKDSISAEEKAHFVEEADKMYEKIGNEKPDAYQAPLYRARLWITDGSKPEEKPRQYYAEAFERIGDRTDADKAKIEAAQYLMIYYLKTENDPESKKYCDIILAINPEHKVANQVKQVLQ